MVETLEGIFFSKSRQSRIPISLLLPSTKETGYVLANHKVLRMLAASGPDEEIFTHPSSLDTVAVKEYSHWGETIGWKDVEADSNNSSILGTSRFVLQLPPGSSYHCFLSYKQKDTIHIVKNQFLILQALGYKCWHDLHCKEELSLEAMMRGVDESMCYILFLSHDVFGSEYVKAEISRALEKKKPIMFLHHPDTDKHWYCTFQHYIDTAPSHIKPLFKQITSIQLHTIHHLEEAVTRQLDEKLKSLIKHKCAEKE